MSMYEHDWWTPRPRLEPQGRITRWRIGRLRAKLAACQQAQHRINRFVDGEAAADWCILEMRRIELQRDLQYLLAPRRLRHLLRRSA